MSRHDSGTGVCNQHNGSTNVGGIPRQDQTSLDAVNNDNICGAWRWTTLYGYYGTVQLEFGVGHHSRRRTFVCQTFSFHWIMMSVRYMTSISMMSCQSFNELWDSWSHFHKKKKLISCSISHHGSGKYVPSSWKYVASRKWKVWLVEIRHITTMDSVSHQGSWKYVSVRSRIWKQLVRRTSSPKN